jgi:PRD1 phage membrane DNA delivery
MNAFTEGLVSIALAIVGLAVVATLVSKNANTSAVIQSGAGGFAESLGAATAPVTGHFANPSFPSSFGSVDLGNLMGS